MDEDQEGAVRKRALELLGPSAAAHGFQAELRRWFTRAIKIESAKGDDFPGTGECEECGAAALCDACIADLVDDQDMPRVRVSPTAFLVHRDADWCDRDETWFLIDVVQVGTRAELRKDLKRWTQFGSDLDETSAAFLRLRLFDENLVQIAEYDEEGLSDIDLDPDSDSNPANDRL